MQAPIRAPNEAKQKTNEIVRFMAAVSAQRIAQPSPLVATRDKPCMGFSVPNTGELTKFQGDSAWMPNSAASAVLGGVDHVHLLSVLTNDTSGCGERNGKEQSDAVHERKRIIVGKEIEQPSDGEQRSSGNNSIENLVLPGEPCGEVTTDDVWEKAEAEDKRVEHDRVFDCVASQYTCNNQPTPDETDRCTNGKTHHKGNYHGLDDGCCVYFCEITHLRTTGLLGGHRRGDTFRY